MLLTV
jgi:hypothetical protein